MKADKCNGSGKVLKVDSFERVACPCCGKKVKPRWSGGGFEGYAKYFYAPTHKIK